MKKLMILFALTSLFIIAGCGGGEDKTQAEAAKTTETPATETPAAETPAGETQLAAHDCDGGCGMKNVPMDQLTEVDGKYYCAGCAKHAQDHNHDGHSH